MDPAWKSLIYQRGNFSKSRSLIRMRSGAGGIFQKPLLLLDFRPPADTAQSIQSSRRACVMEPNRCGVSSQPKVSAIKRKRTVESSASPVIPVISFSLPARLGALGWTHQRLASLPSSMGTKLRAQRDKSCTKDDGGGRERRKHSGRRHLAGSSPSSLR